MADPQQGQRLLRWPATDPSASSARAAEHRLEGTPLFVPVVGDVDLVPRLTAAGGDWQPVASITDASGRRVASVWRDEHGGIVLPFDPDEVLRSYWSEAYTASSTPALARHVTDVARRAYYLARPLMPRAVQIAQRRMFSRVQARSRFPAWPLEPALHDLCDWLLALLADFAGAPVPWLAPWPDGFDWALVLTHDVETLSGVRAIGALREPERRLGMRSSWNFVSGRYDVDGALVEELWRDGFEVGVHGLYHDGHDLESLSTLRSRLPDMHRNASAWGAVGFRSPATQRSWDLMAELGFDYDSSYPDTDPYEPQAGGCCSWLPFFNRDIVELPLTMPQDHTLFTILRQTDATTWIEKAEGLRERGGMALINTHPDYAAGSPLVGAYTAFLERFAGDPTVWHALPRDVSAWWRRRAASVPSRAGERWTVTGPAAGDARLAYAEPERPAIAA
ncbi:MAG: hypothetical protein ACXVFN_15120 [Solirubrobacteraceae bacterium]